MRTLGDTGIYFWGWSWPCYYLQAVQRRKSFVYCVECEGEQHIMDKCLSMRRVDPSQLTVWLQGDSIKPRSSWEWLGGRGWEWVEQCATPPVGAVMAFHEGFEDARCFIMNVHGAVVETDCLKCPWDPVRRAVRADIAHSSSPVMAYQFGRHT